MSTFKPKDFLAGIALALTAILEWHQGGNALTPLIALVLGYYFAKRGNGEQNGH